MPHWTKDPDAVLDYAFDWTAWLGDGEVISDYTVTVPAALTLDSDSESGGVVTVWLSEGTVGATSVAVACLITTNQGRTDERTAYLSVAER